MSCDFLRGTNETHYHCFKAHHANLKFTFFGDFSAVAAFRSQSVSSILILSCCFRYRLVNHYEYLSAWIEKMNLPKKIFLVIHDWGSCLGFHWANQHRDRVAGIAFMEGIVEVFPDKDFFPDDHKAAFQVFCQSNPSLPHLRSLSVPRIGYIKLFNISILICFDVHYSIAYKKDRGVNFFRGRGGMKAGMDSHLRTFLLLCPRLFHN